MFCFIIFINISIVLFLYFSYFIVLATIFKIILNNVIIVHDFNQNRFNILLFSLMIAF